MKIHINIKNLSFEGELEVLREVAPLAVAMAETLAAPIRPLAIGCGDEQPETAAQAIDDDYRLEGDGPHGARDTRNPTPEDKQKSRKSGRPRKSRQRDAAFLKSVDEAARVSADDSTDDSAEDSTDERGTPLRINTGRREQNEAIEFIRQRGQVDSASLAEHLGISRAAASSRLSYYMGRGLVVNVSRGVFAYRKQEED